MLQDHSKLSIVTAPFGLSRKQAAQHIGVCVATWDKLVEKGLMPEPHHLLGLYRYSRAEIEAALHVAPVRGGELPSGMLRADEM